MKGVDMDPYVNLFLEVLPPAIFMTLVTVRLIWLYAYFMKKPQE